MATALPMCVKPLSFAPADLELFAEELAYELQQMDAYEPA